MSKPHILVTGAGGFIGGHLVKSMLEQGHKVRAVDKKPQWQWYQRFPAAENLTLNLEDKDACLQAVNGTDWIYNLAADMGGMGFIELNKGLCMLSVLINTHMLMAARHCGATRFFYSSSACVYAGYKQKETDNPGLKEEDAYPADPEGINSQVARLIANARGLSCFENLRTRVLFFLGKLDLSQVWSKSQQIMRRTTKVLDAPALLLSL